MAQINNGQVVVTDRISHTGDTLWTDVTGATVSSGSFTAGKKYLLHVTAKTSSDSQADESGIRVIHGSTEFTESQFEIETDTNLVGRGHTYHWFTVWTAIGGEGIQVQQQIQNSSQTVRSEFITIKYINLSDDLTEGVDWKFDDNSTATTLSDTAWSTTNNASVEITPAAGTLWLVLSTCRVTPISVGVQIEARCNRTGEATESQPELKIDGEDVLDKYVLTTFRCFTLGAASNTFTQQSKKSAVTGTQQRTYSSVFILNLDRFKDVVYGYTPDSVELTQSGSSYTEQLESRSITPTVTADIWAICYWVFNPDGTFRLCGNRLQQDNVDNPGTQTSVNYATKGWLGTDLVPIVEQAAALSQSAQSTWDNDARVDNAADTSLASHRQLLLVSMELVPGGPPPEPPAGNRLTSIERAGRRGVLRGVLRGV